MVGIGDVLPVGDEDRVEMEMATNGFDTLGLLADGGLNEMALAMSL